jgi:hypothetical protein
MLVSTLPFEPHSQTFLPGPTSDGNPVSASWIAGTTDVCHHVRPVCWEGVLLTFAWADLELWTSYFCLLNSWITVMRVHHFNCPVSSVAFCTYGILFNCYLHSLASSVNFIKSSQPAPKMRDDSLYCIDKRLEREESNWLTIMSLGRGVTKTATIYGV